MQVWNAITARPVLISGSVLFYRLRAEAAGVGEAATEDLERRALRVVGITFFLLAAYALYESAIIILGPELPQPSSVLAARCQGLAWGLTALEGGLVRTGSRRPKTGFWTFTVRRPVSLVQIGGGIC